VVVVVEVVVVEVDDEDVVDVVVDELEDVSIEVVSCT
jgi:hypothetical protein